MHVVRFKEAASLQDLTSKLVDRRVGDPAATMKRVKELNPHVDFKRIKAGTVLILPDEPGIKQSAKDAGESGKGALGDVASIVYGGLDRARHGTATALETAAAERAEVASALKTGIAKRQLESDPGLRKQLEASSAKAEARQKALKEAAGNVDLLRKSFAEELKAMEKLLRF